MSDTLKPAELPITDAEIAGIMGWRGPGAYTEASLRKIRRVVEQAIAADRAQLAQQGQGEVTIHRDRAGLNQFIELYCGNDSRLIACAEAAWNRCMTLNYPTGAAPASAQPATQNLPQEQLENGYNRCYACGTSYTLQQVVERAGYCMFCHVAVDQPAQSAVQVEPASAQPAKQVSDAQAKPGSWKVLAEDDKPSAGRQIDVILQNGVCLVGRAYHEVDWSAVADWRYTNDFAAPQPAARVAVPDNLRAALDELRMVLQMATPSIDQIHEHGPDNELERAWQIFYDDVLPQLAASPATLAAQQAQASAKGEQA